MKTNLIQLGPVPFFLSLSFNEVLIHIKKKKEEEGDFFFNTHSHIRKIKVIQGIL